jgi:hypothetical protein
MDMKRFFLYPIAIAALALAGCGGNGGGGTPPGVPPVACVTPEVDDGMGGCMDPIVVAPTAADPVAEKKAPAIADPDGDGILGENNAAVRMSDDLENPNRPGKGEAADGMDDLFSVTAGGPGTPTVMTIGADRLDMMDAGVDDDNEFAIMADEPVDGFARNVHTRTISDVSDTVTVFDNRDAPGDVEYDTFYETTDRPGVSGTASDDDATLGQLTINEDQVGANSDLFYAMKFPTGDRQTFMYASVDVDATMDVDESKESTFDGMFNGVPGEYSCSDQCEATSDKDGDLAELGGQWTFTPEEVDTDADPHMIIGAKHDDDYLAFGYWLQGTGEGDNVKYGIGTFATGSMPFEVAGVSALVGTAKYSGPAGGMFVMKTDIDGDNIGPVPTSAGKFTAEAALTANFGAATNSGTDFTISGTVNKFALTNYNGSTVDNEWSLELNMARFATPAFNADTGKVDGFSAHASTFGGTTTGMEDGTDGRWEGGFYGPTVVDVEATAAMEQQTGYPTGVAGEFIGHFESGHAIGGFGAEKE